MLCGALSGVWRDAGAALDRPKIRFAAAKIAADLTSRFERVAQDAWQLRSDPHRAWPLRGEGDAIIAEFRRVQGIVDWCDGGVFNPPNASYIPGDGATRGYWICLKLVLEPKTKMLGIPRDIVWPEEAERLLGIAIPAGRGFSELTRQGYYETSEVS